MRVLGVSPQNCATVNRLRGTEVTLPRPQPGSINSDTQTQCHATQRTLPSAVCLCAPAHTACHCTSLKRQEKVCNQRCREQSWGPLESFLARTGSLWLSPGGLEGPLPFSLSSLTLTRRSSTSSCEDGGKCSVCAHERQTETKRQTSKGRNG